MNEKNKERLAELRKKHRGYLSEWKPTDFGRTLSTAFAAGGVVHGTVAIDPADDDPSPFRVWTSGSSVTPPSATWTTTGVFSPVSRSGVTRLPVTSPPSPPKHAIPRAVPAPTKSPRKVVVAFLDDDENVEWCGMFYPDSVDLQHHLREPSEMQLSFKLIDANREAE